MKKLLTVVVAGALMSIGMSSAYAAADGATLYKTKTCIACHGPDGKAPVLPTYPRLAGQNAEYMLNQAKDIKSGARNNGQTAAMKGVMHLVTDDELALITKWLSEQK